MSLQAPDAFSSGKTPTFQESAKLSLADSQLRRNIGKAAKGIREKRAGAVAEFAGLARASGGRTGHQGTDAPPPGRLPLAVRGFRSKSRWARTLGRGTLRRRTASSPESRNITMPGRW